MEPEAETGRVPSTALGQATRARAAGAPQQKEVDAWAQHCRAGREGGDVCSRTRGAAPPWERGEQVRETVALCVTIFHFKFPQCLVSFF